MEQWILVANPYDIACGNRHGLENIALFPVIKLIWIKATRKSARAVTRLALKLRGNAKVLFLHLIDAPREGKA